jgi:hypothetical protein
MECGHQDMHKNREDCNMSRRIINQSGVRWAISTLRPFKSTGTNEIEPVHVQQVASCQIKTNIIKFITNYSPQYVLSIGYSRKYTQESVNTKFLCLLIDIHLNWTNLIDKLIPKLNGACYAVCMSATLTH